MLALAINPMGKVPVLRTDDGDMLSDWGAILFYFAFGTPLWPHMRRDQAEVLSWMFFEQYSHEPALAVLRYLKRFTPDPECTPGSHQRTRVKVHFRFGCAREAFGGGGLDHWARAHDRRLCALSLHSLDG